MWVVVGLEGLRSGTLIEVPGMRLVVMFVMAKHSLTRLSESWGESLFARMYWLHSSETVFSLYTLVTYTKIRYCGRANTSLLKRIATTSPQDPHMLACAREAMPTAGPRAASVTKVTLRDSVNT